MHVLSPAMDGPFAGVETATANLEWMIVLTVVGPKLRWLN
tara:strand:- start:388 stop:507 length:120 start_codon:yes stop_codon:yes gene_type:complete